MSGGVRRGTGAGGRNGVSAAIKANCSENALGGIEAQPSAP